MLHDRGIFVCIEGIDGSGKTTQAKLLENALFENPLAIRFPHRTGPIGEPINAFLQSRISLNGLAFHALCVADRWESQKGILDSLNAGRTVISDRYSYSGMAYTMARGEASLEWCKSMERGIIMPDIVCYLATDIRGAVGRIHTSEIYENVQFLTNVHACYERLVDPTWVTIDGNQTKEQVASSIHYSVRAAHESAKNATIRYFAQP